LTATATVEEQQQATRGGRSERQQSDKKINFSSFVVVRCSFAFL
jgi:hypothetical protein